jgi:selenocysteine lyase/cysteine desulfurase
MAKDLGQQTKMFFCLLILVCLSAAATLAQTTARQDSNEKPIVSLRAGSALSGSSRILPGVAQFILYTISPDEKRQFISILTRTTEVDEQLAEEKIYVSIRGDAIRIAPHLYNDERDIEKLFKILNKLI